jgi:hypothetical protein
VGRGSVSHGAGRQWRVRCVSVLVVLLWRDLDTSVCVSEKESVFVCVKVEARAGLGP